MLTVSVVCLSGYAYALPDDVDKCEAIYNDCYTDCGDKHPRNPIKRQKCRRKCKRHLNACLAPPSPPPSVIVEEPYPPPPVVVDPYPWWGWGGHGWHHHHR